MTFAKDGNDLVGSVAGNEVIRISLTTAAAGPGATEVTYGYTVTLSQAIDQAVPGNEDSDFLSGIGFTVTDNDGTASSGSFGVTIVDDLPTLNVSDTPISVVEGATANGTWTLDKGADGVTSVNVNFGGINQTLSLAPGSSVSIVQPTGTLTVDANGTFSFTAVGNQNNAANPSASFTLSAVDRDGDPTSDSLTIAITDGANPANATPITVTVDEAALNGIGSNPASNAETASGNLSFTAGSDTLSGFAFTGVAGLAANIDGVGTDLFWTLAAGGQTIVGSLTLGGPAAITISLTAPTSIAPGATASATVTVTLADNLPHELAMAAQTAALGTVTVQATDTDGDIATGAVTIQVIDDVPSVTAAAAQPVLTVDESNFAGDSNASFASVFTSIFGADGPAASNPRTYALGINGGSTGLVDSATNEAVVLTVNAGVIEGRTATTNALVFSVSVAANGTVTLDQSRAVLHTPDSGPNQPTSLLTDNLITLTATVTDGDGDTATATANIGQNLIFNDDAPVANDDVAALTEGGPIFVNFDVDTNDTNGADGFGTRTFTSLTGTYGTITLNGDGTQTYTLTAAGQTAINALAPGATLTDSFTYTLTDKDGDSDPATLVVTLTGSDDGVTITNLTPAVDGGDAMVDEDDLPAGSDTSKESLTATGTFNISAPDGVANLSVHGTQVIANGVFTAATITTPLGNILKITAYNAATGEVSYSYTLNAAETHPTGANENSVFENFNVSLTDTDGDNTTSTLSINIIDDVPTARPDADIIVAEDAANVGGNLLTNDTRGADGATVTSVMIGATTTAIAPAGTTTITTANGVYTFTAAGVWTFDPNPVSNAAAVNAGFSYTITDGDGDPSTSTQVISLIDGANPIGGGSITLALDDQNLSDGSTPAGPDFANGSLVFTPGSDAIASIVFAASLAGLGGGLTWVRVSDTQITGSDGARLVVTLDLVRVGSNASVTATLNDNYDDHPGLNVDDLVNLGSVGVVATDTDGDTATGTVTVTVSDDLPTVTLTANDTNSVLLTTQDAETIGAAVSDTATSTANFGGVFTLSSAYGADGAGTTTLNYALGLAVANGGLAGLSSNGAAIRLYTQPDGSIVGSTATTPAGVTSANTIFSLAVNAGGAVTLTQFAEIDHATPGNTAGPYDGQFATLANSLVNLTGTATITDADGDTRTSTTSIDLGGNIRFADDGPSIAVAAPLPILTVDESNFGTNAISAAVFTTNYGADGPGTVTYALGINAGSTGLVDTATGQAVVLTLVGNQVVGTAGAGGPTVFTVAVDASGNITLDQIRAIAHDVDGGPGAAHDDAKTLAAANLITVTGTITDGDGDSAKATINIGQQLTFKDDGPTTTADSGTTTEATLDFNAAFVIDFSGSIDNTELNTMLSAVREAGLLLFGSSSGNVSIRLIGFSSTASNLGVFTDPVSFVNALDGYNPAEGGSRPFNDGTDFTAGIETLMDFYVPSPTASNQVFFLSDGNPNEQTGTGGNSLADATRADWINFVNNGDVNVTAIGVGNGISIPRLQDVNVDGGPAPIVVTAFEDLVETLLDAVVALPVSGDLDANDSFGGDGGRILSITVSGTTYTWDGNNTITRTGTLTGNVAGNSISTTTPEGATLTLNFATGIWSYAPDATPTAASEVFNYTVIDGDGDTAGSTLTVTVVEGGGPGGANIASADIVITNASGSGAAVQIAEAALLANDQAGTVITGSASNVTDATSVTRGGGNFTFTDNDADGGSFFYATTPADTARVTVNRAQAGETQLDGTSANDILVGRDDADDTIIGKTGSDYMYGLGGNDIFNLANGHFGAGELIDGGAGTDGIVLTNATTVNFATGTIVGVETLTGSGSSDTVTMSAQQWAAFSTINLAAGGSDVLTVNVSGAVNISAAAITTVSNTETGNLTGSGGADTITLTGDQLNAILIGSGTINLGLGTDTIVLTSTSSDLNGLNDAGLSGVEVISAAGAGAGVTINLANQTEALTIIGSASADTLTGGSGVDTISGGAGADIITGGGGADVLTGDAGNDRFLLANGNFVAGESINGGADNDTIELTNATTVDFTTGTITSIETLTGSSGLDNVTMSVAQWLSFGAIDLGGNANDVLTITFSGAVNLTAASLPVVSNVEVGNVTGSSGADTLTLTGAQLDAIIQASGTIDLGGNTTDTIVLTSTSADLNGLGDGRLVNVEAVSASGAAAGVTINLGNQTETIAITGSANGDAITASTGTNSVVNAGAGADTVTINAGALTSRNWAVDLGSDAVADKIVFNHDAVGTGDDTVVTVSSFNVAQDKIAVSVAGTSETDGTFVTVTGTQTNIAAGAEVIELVNNAWVTTSLGNDGNGSTIEGFIQAATNAIPTGTYTFIVYSDATGTANAGIYSVTISDATDPGSGGMVVEHIMTINGVGYGNLSAANFVGAADPILLDLAGDGYSFGATALFDINADGAADQVTWNSSNDGILAVDLDGNGTIDNGTEIFTPGFGGGKFANGTEALASLDDNGDGVIDANDAAFAKLLVWQDANADGVSDAGELSGLADHGIVSISTGAAHADETIDGQQVTARGTFTRADGSTGDYIEAQLDTQLGTRASAREAEDAQRAAGNQALTNTLVAASLVAMVSEAQPDNVAPQTAATEDAQATVPTETGAAAVAAAAAESVSSTASDNLSDTPKAAAPDHSATLHSDDSTPAAIDDTQDSGWRAEVTDNSTPADSDSLFDMIADRGSSDTGVMDGLLALGALPAAAAPADVAAHDPAAVAVLAEVMESGAVDHLINAIVGSGEPLQVAASETPAFDLAQFLDQKVAPDVAFPISQPLEQDLHNMAAA